MNKEMLKILGEKAEEVESFETEKKITWCGNCGNYGIHNALMQALALEEMERNDFVICYDVGCSGNGSDKIEANTIHGLHGRVLPLAAGCSIANRGMKVIAEAGDGATFSEGVNHLVHAVRNNYNVMFIFHNNENYGLTTGQASALTRKGVKMNATPGGVSVEPLKAMSFVLGLNPSFVARAYTGNVEHMTEVFREGLKHDGFAFIEVFQACPTYNKATPDHWFAERVVELKKPFEDIWEARKAAEDLEKKIPIGVIYKNEEKLCVSEGLPAESLVDGVKRFSIEGLVE